jgi:dimethylhistidine N-methyltransferase
MPLAARPERERHATAAASAIAACPLEGRSLDPARAEFAADVRDGLTHAPLALPSRWLYDDVGSALFEAITALDEYPLTRAEERVIARHAGDLAARAPSGPIVIELGAGSGRKTRRILEALAARGPVEYRPIDVSRAALDVCTKAVAGVAPVVAIEDSYLRGLARALEDRGDRPALVLFLGSTIGNFSREHAAEFVRAVRAALAPGDMLLLAADLVKPVAELVLAYDDPTGVTAAFDRNVLARINRELDGDFDLRAFRHEARWNQAERRIEMHLVATRPIVAHVAAADIEVRMERGQSIWTESSHKWSEAEVAALGEAAGFTHVAQWRDDAWPFVESLFAVR